MRAMRRAESAGTRWRGLAGLVAVIATVTAWTPVIAADLSAALQYFADAGSVTLDEPSGEPPSAVVRAGDGRVLGYAFSTRQVSGSVGYSGRPLDIVAAVTPEGLVAGATIVAHEEPILVIGIPREALAAYVANFRGFDIRGGSLQATREGARGPHAVAGASVTSAVIRDAIVRSARVVLRMRGATAQPTGRPELDRESARRASWPALVADGALRRLSLSRGEVARLLGTTDTEPDKAFIDLWMALATPPAIGESLLGQRSYESEIGKIGSDDDLVLIAASGLYSFRGTEWRRSGVFDRIEIVQGDKTFRLRAADHVLIDLLHSAGTPELREIGLFRMSHANGFDSTLPFRLDLILVRDPPTAIPAPVVSLDYRIPDAYLIQPSQAGPVEPAASARAARDRRRCGCRGPALARHLVGQAA